MPLEVAIGIDPHVEPGAVPERGVVVVSWLEPPQAEQFGRARQLPPASIVPFVARSRVAQLDRGQLLGADGVRVELLAPATPPGVVPIALFDGDQAFWPAVMGAPVRTLIGIGAPTGVATGDGAPSLGGGARVELAPNPPRESHGTRFECSGERFETLDVDGDGATPARKACAYLPPSYRREPNRRYPVVYLLSGLGGNETVRFTDADLLARADELAGRQLEAILVGVDTRSPRGSIYVTEHTLAAFTHTVAAVDARLRTLAAAPARGLLGQSTGGFNAVSALLLAPDVFGAVAASAPDALDFESWLLEPDGRVRPQWLAWMRLEAAVGGAGQMLSYAESWSLPRATPELVWPVDLDTARVRPDVLEAWLGHSPARLARTPAGKRALERASGKIFISSSKADEFGLFEPAQRFTQELQVLGIAHEFSADEGGHFDVRGRLSDLLGRLLAVLTPAQG